jgi:uncharacterized protein YbjT (DUF2867 family)
MSILVVGGGGSIGSLLVSRILEEGYEVKCLVRDFRKARGLKKLGADLLYGDLLIPSTLPPLFKGVKLLIDSSASLYESSYASEDLEWRGRLALLEIAKLAHISKFIGFTSLPRLPIPLYLGKQLGSRPFNLTCQVADKTKLVTSPTKNMFNQAPRNVSMSEMLPTLMALVRAYGFRGTREAYAKKLARERLTDTRLSKIPYLMLPRDNPSWVYGFKLLFEIEKSGLNYTIVRFTGTFQRTIQEFLIPILEKEGIERPKILFRKNYIDAADLSKAILKIIQNPLYEQKIVSIEGDEFLTESQIIDFCERSMRQSSTQQTISKLTLFTRRKFSQFFEFTWTLLVLNVGYIRKPSNRPPFLSDDLNFPILQGLGRDYYKPKFSSSSDKLRLRFRKSYWPFEKRSFLACLKDYVIRLNSRVSPSASRSSNSSGDNDDVRFF